MGNYASHHSHSGVYADDVDEQTSSVEVGNKDKKKKSNNPGSYEDIHEECFHMFPKKLLGVKLATRCNQHSQLYASIVHGSSNEINLDYRWSGSPSSKVLHPYFLEIPNKRHETIKRHYENTDWFNFRLSGNLLQHIPGNVALNFNKAMVEYAQDDYTLGITARNLFIGKQDAWHHRAVGVDRVGVQAFYSVHPIIDIGVQVNRLIDETGLNGVKWNGSLGARFKTDNMTLSATVTDTLINLYLKDRFYNNFEVGLGAHFCRLGLGNVASAAFQFTCSNAVVKLAADTRKELGASIAFKSGFSFPSAIVISAKCGTDADLNGLRRDWYKCFGLGMEFDMN